jgi:hypothetical protein
MPTCPKNLRRRLGSAMILAVSPYISQCAGSFTLRGTSAIARLDDALVSSTVRSDEPLCGANVTIFMWDARNYSCQVSGVAISAPANQRIQAPRMLISAPFSREIAALGLTVDAIHGTRALPVPSRSLDELLTQAVALHGMHGDVAAWADRLAEDVSTLQD